jgi:TolB-like protein
MLRQVEIQPRVPWIVIDHLLAPGDGFIDLAQCRIRPHDQDRHLSRVRRDLRGIPTEQLERRGPLSRHRGDESRFQIGVDLRVWLERELLRSSNCSVTIADGDAARQLEPVISKCLIKNRESRYQSAEELLRDLRALQTGSVATVIRQPVETPRPWHRSRTALVAFALTLLAISVIVFGPEWRGGLPQRQSSRTSASLLAPERPLTSVAVLPFANLASAGDEYLSDGFTEEIIGILARSRNLKVVSRTSSFALRNAPGDVREIGRQLGVSTVVEGSSRIIAGTIRVQAQLVNVEDGYNLWSSGVYEGTLDDVLTLHQQLGRGIAAALKAELHGSSVSGENSPDPEAYQLYLRGRYHLNKYHRIELPKAIDALKLAETLIRAFEEGLALSYK